MKAAVAACPVHFKTVVRRLDSFAASYPRAAALTLNSLSHCAAPATLRALEALAPSVRRLNMGGCRIGSVAGAAAALMASISCLSKLQFLDISFSSLGDVGVVALAAALESLPQLHHLNVGSNLFSEEACRILRHAGGFWCKLA